MKKIGIITIHNSPNYGACLQSYGLYHFLNNIGIDCEIIDLHRPTHNDYVESKKYTATRTKNKNFLKNFLLKLVFKKRKKTMSVKAMKRFNNFNSRIKLSKPYLCIDTLYENPPYYDVYISGSDQLWNPTIGFCNEPYFLTFVKNKSKRISYATSIGIDKLTENEKENYSKWLDSYNHISVREKSAKDLLESFIEKKIEQVADPSFLPERSHWTSMAKLPYIEAPYILLFTLSYNEYLLQMCRRFKKESGMQLIYLCLNQPKKNCDYKIEKDAGPEEWLGYLAKAEMVITDSFHGSVFSIIMGTKNFFTYVPSSQKRGKRITDLLDTYQLSEHVFTEDDLKKSFESFYKRKLNHKIITDIYMIEQERSRSYLTYAINN